MKSEIITRCNEISSRLGSTQGDILEIYNSVSTKGSFGIMELMQLSSMGIPILSELAKNANVDVRDYCEGKLIDGVREGPFPVSVDDFEKAIITIADAQGPFYDMGEVRKKTIKGRMKP